MTWLLLTLILAIGCGRSHGVDTGNLASSFKTAEPSLKAEADKAILSIKAGNFTDAVAELEHLGKRAKLTAEQQQVIKDTIDQIQKQIEIAAKAKESPPAKK